MFQRLWIDLCKFFISFSKVSGAARLTLISAQIVTHLLHPGSECRQYRTHMAQPSSHVVFGGLPADMTAEKIPAIFGPYGDIVSWQFLPRLASPSAVLQFKTVAQAAWLVQHLNGNIPATMLHLGQAISVAFADEERVPKGEGCAYEWILLRPESCFDPSSGQSIMVPRGNFVKWGTHDRRDAFRRVDEAGTHNDQYLYSWKPEGTTQAPGW